MLNTSDAYINTVNYKKLESKLNKLCDTMESLMLKVKASRRLRYTEIDIEAERKMGRLAPDELLVPQHIIDTNIRREQSAYIQYITQSPRAVILQDRANPANDPSLIERDITNRIRYDGWQQPEYRVIDCFQQEGYAIKELVQDQTKPGELAFEEVGIADFGFYLDSKSIQSNEQIIRRYYFTRTSLLAFTKPEKEGGRGWSTEQVEKVIKQSPTAAGDTSQADSDLKDRSLYSIEKVMFRVKGIVQVAWMCNRVCDDWIRAPKPLYLGRQRTLSKMEMLKKMTTSQYELSYEKDYPYYLFPYTISENPTISELKGRVYLDQDTQEATTSLMSSFVTAHRRGSGLYFSKDVSDPNDDVLMQKNVYFKTGALINSKVTQFQLQAPGPEMISGIQMLVSANQSENAQINFAVNNRKDSRKTAAEVNAAGQQAQQLTTVQVTLYSTALKASYQSFFDIVKSRICAGLIAVDQPMKALYMRDWIVKPSGDTDVIERQQKIAMMQQAWVVVSKTPAAPVFLAKMLSLLFPDDAPQYLVAMQQAQQQQQSQQATMMKQAMGIVMQVAKGIIKLSKQPEMFSEIGRTHAFPIVENMGNELEQLEAQMKQQPKQQQ